MTEPATGKGEYREEEVTTQQARDSLVRFNASHFRQHKGMGEQARYSIPADPSRDDDLLLSRFIDQYDVLEAAAPSAAVVEAIGQTLELAVGWAPDRIVPPGLFDAVRTWLASLSDDALTNETAELRAKHYEQTLRVVHNDIGSALQYMDNKSAGWESLMVVRRFIAAALSIAAALNSAREGSHDGDNWASYEQG